MYIKIYLLITLLRQAVITESLKYLWILFMAVVNNPSKYSGFLFYSFSIFIFNTKIGWLWDNKAIHLFLSHGNNKYILSLDYCKETVSFWH